MQSIVELRSVSFAYEHKNVLTDVNLTVPSGEFASIVGPNGGGKTTLVKIILGLLEPQKGNVLLFGDTPCRSRLRVGYTPQYSSLDNHFPILVRDVVLMGRFGQNIWKTGKRSLWDRLASMLGSSREDRRIALEAMDKVRIADLADRPFGEISGGQRQRVFIARALAAEPELLILDEPTNNIDPSSMELFYSILTELNKTTAILIVSHDLGVVSQYVRSVICVNEKVVVHPTTSLNGTVIRDLYGSDVRLVRHDHRCSENGHDH